MANPKFGPLICRFQTAKFWKADRGVVTEYSRAVEAKHERRPPESSEPGQSRPARARVLAVRTLPTNPSCQPLIFTPRTIKCSETDHGVVTENSRVVVAKHERRPPESSVIVPSPRSEATLLPHGEFGSANHRHEARNKITVQTSSAPIIKCSETDHGVVTENSRAVVAKHERRPPESSAIVPSPSPRSVATLLPHGEFGIANQPYEAWNNTTLRFCRFKTFKCLESDHGVVTENSRAVVAKHERRPPESYAIVPSPRSVATPPLWRHNFIRPNDPTPSCQSS